MLTLDTEIDTKATITVNEEIRLVLQINDLNIAIKGVIDTAVGPITYWRINAALFTILLVLEGYINVFLKDGWDLNTLLHNLLGIKAIYLKEMVLVE